MLRAASVAAYGAATVHSTSIAAAAVAKYLVAVTDAEHAFMTAWFLSSLSAAGLCSLSVDSDARETMTAGDSSAASADN